jgi:zinc protease
VWHCYNPPMTQPQTEEQKPAESAEESAESPRAYTGYTYIQTVEGISEYRLKKNGLTVLVKEDRSAPVATVTVTYLAGSAHEVLGHTGVAHMLEHMMFKESENFRRKDKRDINHVLDKRGAMLNATTWNDRTKYYECVGVEHVETAIALEADRMRRAIIEDKELQPEKVVVRNEFEIGQNNPIQILYDEMSAVAYQAFPYHHDTIGYLSDIKGYTVEELKNFYNTYYHPNNAVVSVIGAISEKEALGLVKEHLGVYEAKKGLVSEILTEEPMQTGERRVRVKRTGKMALVGVAHKKPGASHKDTPALQVLSAMLGDGKASILNRALIDTGMATSVEMDVHPFRYESLFMTFVTLTPETSHEDVERSVKNIYMDITKKGVSEEVLARAKARLKAKYTFDTEGTMSLSDWVSEAVAMGDWTLAFSIPKRIADVSVRDVKRVAKKYLKDDTCTVGYYEAVK